MVIIDYGDLVNWPNLVRIGSKTASPGGGRRFAEPKLGITFCFSGWPGQNREPIWTNDTSKRVFWFKDVPFEV